jgi:hypothetical protein
VDEICQRKGDFQTAQRHVLILDDNFHLRSMRKKYFQLARLARVQFKQVFVDVSLDECRMRVQTREAAKDGTVAGASRATQMDVPDFVLAAMADAFERPDMTLLQVLDETHTVRDARHAEDSNTTKETVAFEAPALGPTHVWERKSEHKVGKE